MQSKKNIETQRYNMRHRYLAIILIILCVTGSVQGQSYITGNQLPNAINYLPAPPDTASMLFVDDFQQWIWGKSLRDTPRGEQASQESLYGTERIATISSGIFGFEVSAANSPAIWNLIERSGTTGALAVASAKMRYKRARPFVTMNEHTAGAYDNEEALSADGSYPSAHTAFGWTAMMALAEMAPALQDTLLRRGYEYGESRVIVGAHWQSDIDASLLIGGAVMARLHGNNDYLADLAEAKAEYQSLHGSNPSATRCADLLKILPGAPDTASYRYYGDIAALWYSANERDSLTSQILGDADTSAYYLLDILATAASFTSTAYEMTHTQRLIAAAGRAVAGEVTRVAALSHRTNPSQQLDIVPMLPVSSNGSSYPSLSAALGWAAALALTEVAPDKQNKILKRGYDYGYNAMVAATCYASDLLAGRVLAECVLSRMHNDAAFLAMVDSARVEYLRLNPSAKISSARAAAAPTLKRVGDWVFVNLGNRTGTVTIYSPTGQQLRTMTLAGDSRIPLEGLPHGSYVVTLASGKYSTTLKATR